MDADLLQNKVFDLEQSSTEKDLIIGKQDIRISELEKKKSRIEGLELYITNILCEGIQLGWII